MRLSFTFLGRRLALASLVLLGACIKNNDGPSPSNPNSTTYYISWTVDGQDYVSSLSSQSILGNTLQLTAVAKSSTSQDVNTLTISVPAAVGTYDLNVSVPNTTYMATYQTYSNGVTTAYTASNLTRIGLGTVAVTTLSNEDVVGAFSFVGTTGTSPATSKTITNGKFYLRR